MACFHNQAFPLDSTGRVRILNENESNCRLEESDGLAQELGKGDLDRDLITTFLLSELS